MGEKKVQFDRGHMRRTLGIGDLFAIGYGDLGSSIYYALGITALYALGAAPIALLLAGLVFACTALTYAEISSIMQEAGGSASFSRKTFNDLISFIAGWALLLDYIVTIAISAYTVGPYLAYFFPALKMLWVKIAFPIVLIVLMIGLNIRGNKQSTRLSLILTVLTILTQVIIIVIGCATIVDLPEFFSHLRIGGPDKAWSPTWGNFFYGMVMAMVAYTGIESMAQLSAEAKTPKKTVPKAIMLAMGILLLMYAGISVTALSAVTPEVLSTTYKEDPIAGIVAALPIGSAVLGPWVGLLAAIILVVAANAGLMGASRLSFNMGEYFQLPRTFYRLHKTRKTPYVALVFFGILASLVIVWSEGSLDALAELYSFGAMLAFACAHIALLVHRYRFPKMDRPFKSPLNIGNFSITALVGAVMTISVWCFIVFTKPAGRNFGAIWVVLGLIMYFVYRRQQRLSPTTQVEIENIRMTAMAEFSIKHILLLTKGSASIDTIAMVCDMAKRFGAVVTVIHATEVPYMLPIGTKVLQKDKFYETLLKQALAIGTEKGVRVDARMIQSRSVGKVIKELVDNEGFDLVVLEAKTAGPLGIAMEQLFAQLQCRVWICKA